MPRIDELEGVVVASDDDMIPVSQNGIVRRVSRSQLLAGTQSTLSFAPGLVGRVSTGLGAPQHITVGGGLSLADGVLSGAPKYSAAALPLSTNLSLSDLVPAWQNGQDNAVTVRTLLSVAGVDVSGQVARAGQGTPRRLEQWFGDAIAVEAFGARGDGLADDTAALDLAIASGRPVLLGPRTYRVDGQWNVQSSAALIGTVGMTVLRRVAQVGGAWINVTAPTFTSIGVTFDAGGIAGDSWALLITQSCTETTFRDCSFSNATGAVLGTGLTIQARDGLTGTGSKHSIVNCTFDNNTCHGLWIQAAAGAVVSQCRASHNGGFGICLDFNDPSFKQVVRESYVTDCRCWGNTRGISIGNYNSTNREPPRWGLEHPDAQDITVAGNLCCGNSAYGIAVSGKRISVTENRIILRDEQPSASGILCNSSLTTLTGNSVVGPGQFGIDAGGSSDTEISSNAVVNCAVGINAGGSVRVNVADNKLVGNSRAVTVFQVETDGRGQNFGLACSDIWLERNLIQIEDGGAGVCLFDGPERVEISRNRLLSSGAVESRDLCWANTDSVSIQGNTWNGSFASDVSSQTNGLAVQVTVSDILDRAVLPTAVTRVDSVSGPHQVAMSGQVSFVRVQSGGAGYTEARVVIAGGGSGALATAYLRDGVVIGIAVSSGGSGYDPATTSATVLGDGVGALLQPFVGLPVAPGRRLSLRCVGPVHFPQGGANAVRNWTNTDVTVAGGSEIVLEGVDNGWQAASFTSIDYLRPGTDGSVSVRSVQGDIRLSTAPGGAVRLCSDIEQTGFLVYFGHGSPEGRVIAPPGSDYRNLDGGVGKTLWLKRVGNDSFGWYPIA